MLNWETVSGLVRHVLTFGGGFMVGNGVISNDELTVAVSAIVSLGGVIWSIWSKRQQA